MDKLLKVKATAQGRTVDNHSNIDRSSSVASPFGMDTAEVEGLTRDPRLISIR